VSYVGKVNMDRDAPDYLRETTEESQKETLRWLEGCKGFTKVKPILTPRFAPSCTDELLAFLGKLKAEKDLPVQSHLSENLGEIALVAELFPDCGQYWEVYDK
jgi:guanine deaminase